MTVEVHELTPRGRGGVSILRVAGAGARAAVAGLTNTSKAGSGVRRSVPKLVRLASGAGTLDVALVLERSAEEVELHVHGSPPLVRALMRELSGDSPAARNVEERAREVLAGAASEAAARMLLDQAEGALRIELESLAVAPQAELEARLAVLASRFAVARYLVTPPAVVLAGAVNAGKSTLFNALLGRERVVISPEEGTTRDAIREPIQLGAYAVVLVDAAGGRELRDSTGGLAAVEREGQVLAAELRASSDLVLYLRPPGAAVAETPGCAVLDSRGDLQGCAPGALRPREDPLGARRAVEEAFHRALGLPSKPWTPGAAVPFTSDLAEVVARLAHLDPSRRVEAVAELLGTPTVGASPGPG